MKLNVNSKKIVNITDDKNNFSSERVDLKEIMGVSSFSDLSERHFNFLLNHKVADPFTQKANDALAGHIENQFWFNEWPEDFEKYLISKIVSDQDLVNGAKKFFPSKLRIYDGPNFEINLKLLYDNLSLGAMWINKQRKYEFNPIHNHHGIFSFIIPLQIPYDLNEEDKMFQVGHLEKSPKTSRLEFFKCDKIHSNHEDGARLNYEIRGLCLNVDKSYLGKLLMFPAKLHHMVYPFFTSDGIRITVSGNIVLR